MRSPKEQPGKSPIAIVGLGAVGRILAGEIARRRIGPLALVGRKRRSKYFLTKRTPVSGQIKLADLNINQGIILLTVPTLGLQNAAHELAKLALPWRKITVLHTSGSLSAEVLEPLRKLGAGVAACHPFQTFPKRAKQVTLDGILWGLDGNTRGLKAARTLVKALGGKPVRMPGPKRLAYHASAVMACTFIGADLDMSRRTLMALGLKDSEAQAAALAIAEETIKQIRELGIESALTGPAIRGDRALIERHTKALHKLDPGIADAYKVLSEYLVRRKG